MKIQLQRDAMLSSFSLAAMVAPSRSPKEILQYVKIEIRNGKAVIMATDLEVGIRATMAGVETTEEHLDLVVPVDRFSLILRESKDEVLTLDVKDNVVTIEGQHSHFELPSPNPDEYPTIIDFTESDYVELPRRLLHELIRRTVFATDTESSRYALGGVLLECDGDTLVGVATDGRRLAKMTGPVTTVGSVSSGVMTIIPTRAMQLLERALGDNDGDVQVALRSNDVLIRCEDFVFYSRLVEGRFPKWQEVFPQRVDARSTDITIGPFYSALRQASIVASTESRGINLTFGDGTLVLSASTSEKGDSRVEVPIAYSGPEIVVTLDHRYVSDFLRVLELEQTIRVEFESAESPVLFIADESYGYVVMPLSPDR
ncbi:MAG: DNA polymerase III subunit beta [Pirellulaceae bacterium]|nr:DNA polymerase III subunit beta [Planctomycetaceae bacterium]HIM30076.1 DNA polymerase III subunit beta [Planctomycetota bacterium]